MRHSILKTNPLLLLLTLTFWFLFGISGCKNAAESDSSGGDKLTAKVDGKPFEAMSLSLSAQVNAGIPGSLLFLGSQTVDGTTQSITMTVYNVFGSGEYPLGVDMSIYGGVGQFGESSGGGGNANAWITTNNGRSGKLFIKAIGSGRVSGTFEFVCEPGVKNALGVGRTITDGLFDLPYSGTYAPAAENKGSKVSATLNGKPYYAGTVVALLQDQTGGAGIQFSSLNSETGLSIHLEGVTSSGTYSLSNTSPIRTITAGRNGGTAEFCCWQTGDGATGTITVTKISTTRIQGSLSATLKPSKGKAATADMVIEVGQFDVAIGI